MTTWLVTGCSTGLGNALAHAALTHGDNVVATARDQGTLCDLVAGHPDTALALALDVNDRDQISAVIDQAVTRSR